MNPSGPVLPSSRPSRRGRARRLLSVGALAAIVVLVVSSCSALKDPDDNRPSAAGASGQSGSTSPSPSSSTPSSTPPASPTPSPTPTKLGAPVNLSSDLIGDGSVVGVGLPIVIQFSRSISSSAAFLKAASVTVNGKPAGGAWYFEKPYADRAMQAHYRPETFWPAHSKVHLGLAVKGKSAGAGLSFANDLTLDYSIGASHISTIDAQKLTMTTRVDGKVVKTFPVSLGASKTPTYNGTKVVMEKDRNERMIGPGYNEVVPWSVRITTSGEFIHAAAWNTNIGLQSTSNGCTNLRTQDAIWYFNFAQIGDVALYPNAPGPKQPSWDGFGDWNVDWSTWQAGGLLHTA